MKYPFSTIVLISVTAFLPQSALSKTSSATSEIDRIAKSCIGKAKYFGEVVVCYDQQLTSYQKLLKKQKYFNKTRNNQLLSACGSTEWSEVSYDAERNENYICKIKALRSQLK